MTKKTKIKINKTIEAEVEVDEDGKIIRVITFAKRRAQVKPQRKEQPPVGGRVGHGGGRENEPI